MKFEPETFTFALHILNYFQQIHTILGMVDISVMLLLESATDTCRLSTQVYTPLPGEGENVCCMFGKSYKLHFLLLSMV
jgi:hypothetical protein